MDDAVDLSILEVAGITILVLVTSLIDLFDPWVNTALALGGLGFIFFRVYYIRKANKRADEKREEEKRQEKRNEEQNRRNEEQGRRNEAQDRRNEEQERRNEEKHQLEMKILRKKLKGISNDID